MTGEPAVRNVFCHLPLLPKALIPDNLSVPVSWKTALGRSQWLEAVGGGKAHPSFSSHSTQGSVGHGEGLAVWLVEVACGISSKGGFE